MSELKSETAYFMSLQEGENARVCLKSEVDKVIAEKDAEIARLKALAKEPYLLNRVCRKCGREGTLLYMPTVEDNHTFWDLYNNKGIDYVFNIRCTHCGEVAFVTRQTHDYELKTKELKTKAVERYKRCLAMAQEWRSLAGFYGMKASCFNHRGFGCTAQKYSRREFHAWKCVKQWLAIAEKFKEAQT